MTKLVQVSVTGHCRSRHSFSFALVL